MRRRRRTVRRAFPGRTRSLGSFRRFKCSSVVVAILVLALTAGDAAALSPGQIQADLNGQRQANGIPVLPYSPGLADGCGKHNNYMAENGTLQHEESPGAPGYTREGANAGAKAVLADDQISWTARSSPWTAAPLHLISLFDPARTFAGGASSRGYNCLALDGHRGFTGPSFHSFPGPGRHLVPLTMRADESPFVPQQLVGLSAGTTTGYQLIVYANGLGPMPERNIAEASLSTPTGPVDLRVADSRYSQWLDPTAAVLIPVHTLAPFTTYTARLIWRNRQGGRYPTAFSFETDGRPNDMTVDVARRKHGHLLFLVRGRASNKTLALRSTRGSRHRLRVRRGRAKSKRLPAGYWNACARSGGRSVGYALTTACEHFKVYAHLRGLRLSAPRHRRGHLAVTLSVPKPARGRRATMRVGVRKRSCFRASTGGRFCSSTYRTIERKPIRHLRRKQVLSIRPRAGLQRVTVSIKRFRRGQTPYGATTVKRTVR